MRVRQAAERLEVSEATVYALVASGQLHCVRIGNGRGTIRILEEHLAEYLVKAEPVTAPPAPHAAKPKLKHIRL